MRLEVDTGAYSSATAVLDDADRGVTESVGRLVSTLDGCAAMSGTDAGGRAWAGSYDQAAGELVRAGADLGGSMGAMANLLDASLANHEGADQGACLFPGPVGGASAGLGRRTERLSPAALPSAYGGTGGVPDGWHWLAGHLEGLLWPDADTGAMRLAAEAWSASGSLVESWSASAAGASYLLEGQRSPEVPIAATAARELGRHGADLAAGCRDLARACAEYAEQVDAHHAEVADVCRDLLTWTVVDETTGAVLGFFTGGGAEVAAQLVESGVLGRYAARVVAILRRLLELAHAAAELMARGIARVAEILTRLRRFLSLTTVRALERVGSSMAGRRVLERLPAAVREQVDEAIERAASGKVRFPGHDGKTFRNDDPSYRLPLGDYRSWTVAASRSTRGELRVLIKGDPTSPDAIYLWDHLRPPVRIGP